MWKIMIALFRRPAADKHSLSTITERCYQPELPFEKYDLLRFRTMEEARCCQIDFHLS